MKLALVMSAFSRPAGEFEKTLRNTFHSTSVLCSICSIICPSRGRPPNYAFHDQCGAIRFLRLEWRRSLYGLGAPACPLLLLHGVWSAVEGG
ncbi:hypothetical protein BDW71DRAFT_25271 [Aspergillus fruticulosus]